MMLRCVMLHRMSYSTSAVDITGVETSSFKWERPISLKNKEGDTSTKKSIKANGIS